MSQSCWLRIFTVITVLAGCANISWGGYASLTDLAEFKVDKGSGIIYYTPLAEDPFCVKFSNEQYDAARALGLLSDTPTADNLRSKFDCTYHPGLDPNVYWLCIENHGGDWDFKDVLIHVTDHQDGTYLLDISAGNFGSLNSIISKPDGLLLLDLPHNTQGLQLTLPAPEPATLSLLAVGGLIALLRRR